MSETTPPASLSYMPVETPVNGMVRIGGALGIAACFVGLAVFLAGCAGFGKAFGLCFVVLGLSLAGLIVALVGAIKKMGKMEDTRVLAALFVNAIGILGALLEMAILFGWKLLG